MRLIKRLVALVVLAAAAYAGFRWGDKVFPPLERLLGHARHPAAVEARGGAPQPSQAIADSTLALLQRFRDGKGPGSIRFGSTQLTSVVRYDLPGLVPPGVADPTVALRDGRVHVSARAAVGAFPRLRSLDRVVGILPDTVLIEAEGTLVRVDQQHLGLLVDHMAVDHIPLPRPMIADVLAHLGADRDKLLPRDALLVPMPDGLSAAFVQRDSLVLLAKR